MTLNISQKNAIEFINGPCLVLAGAGSGKTKVIINKIIYLINSCQYKPNNIAAVTFTNKAAREMKVRLLNHLTVLEAKKIMISTFHSLGLEIIKKEIDSLEFNSNFSLFDEKDQMILLKKISDTKIKNDKKYLKKIISMISYWKNKFLTPLQIQSSACSNIEKNIASIYNTYNLYLRDSNILDFDDLICIPTMLLKKNKKIQNSWQKKISYLLVDEYQDTNRSQYEFIKMITNINSNFTLVGDDDQSIYSWRGADPKNIFLLKKDFPLLQVIKMEHNYRSSGRILKAANNLISNNIHYVQKNLFSQLEYGNRIKILIGDNEENEAEKIVKHIIFQYSRGKKKYQDYAILYRGNYQSRILEKVLIKKDIPYNISENSSFFSRSEIKDLLSYLRVIINPDDNYALMRILNIPSRKIGLITLNKLEKWAVENKKSFFQTISDANIKNFINETTNNRIKKFVIWIKKIIKLSFLQPCNILETIIHDIKYEEWLSKTLKDPKKIKTSMHNLDTISIWFKNMLKGSNVDEPMTLSQIVIKMTLGDMVEKKTKKDDIDKVQLMTLHASKGLEFSSVFIIGMSEGILPNHRSIDENNIEEERRLTYVGITRAKKELHLSYCCKRTQYGKTLYAEPSRFLFELPQEDLKWEKDIFFKTSYTIKNILKSRINDLKKILKHKK